MIQAAAEPAQLSMEDAKMSQLDFGNIERGKDATLRVRLKNSGGVAASIAPLNMPPFFIATPLAELQVEPNSSKELVFAFKPDMPGKYEKVLTVASTGGDLSFTARATMVDPRRPGAASTANPAIGIQNPHTPARMTAPGRQSIGSGSTSSSSAPPVPSLPVTAAAKPTPAVQPVASETTPEDGPQMTAKAAALGMVQQFGLGLESLPVFRSQLVDPMQAVRAFDVGAEHVVLGWLLPEQNPPATVRVETAQFVFNKELKTVLKTWAEVKGWQPAQAPEGAGAARIEGLVAGRQYEFRVLGVDSQGRLSKGSDIVSIQTLPPSYFSKEWIIAGIILLLLGIAGWGYYQQRQRLSAPARGRLSAA